MDVRIDALRLRVAGTGEGSAQRLASLIAQRLSSVWPTAGPGDLARLDVTLQARPGDNLDDLADGAATEVVRALSASGTPARTAARGTST